MAIINVGMTIEDAEEIARKAENPAPAGIYTLQCTSCAHEDENGQPLMSQSGRPKVVFTLEIVQAQDPDLNGKKVWIHVPLPSDGNTRGIGNLVKVTRALGKPYTGTDFDTDDYPGLTCQANLGISKDGKWNEIISFI